MRVIGGSAAMGSPAVDERQGQRQDEHDQHGDDDQKVRQRKEDEPPVDVETGGVQIDDRTEKWSNACWGAHWLTIASGADQSMWLPGEASTFY